MDIRTLRLGAIARITQIHPTPVRDGETIIGILGDGDMANMAWFSDGRYFQGRDHPWDIINKENRHAR